MSSKEAVVFAPRHPNRTGVLATTFGVALIAVLFPLAAGAAEPSHDKMTMEMPKSYGEFMKMDPAECMAMVDHDHDGSVSKAEYMKFHEAFFKKMAKKNPDRITREEWLGQIHSSP